MLVLIKVCFKGCGYPGRGRGQGSLDQTENRKNIVFPCNDGPVKNHKVANLAFNVGPSSVCQQIQWRFAGGPMPSR